MPVRTVAGNEMRALHEAALAPVFRQMKRLYRAPAGVPAEISALRFERARARLVDALGLRGSAKVPAAVRSSVKACALRWAERGLPGEFADLDRLELEFARSRELLEAEESGDEQRVLAVLERSYCQRLVEDFCSVELKGLPISHRVRASVERVYVPLNLQRGDGLVMAGAEGEHSKSPNLPLRMTERLNLPVPAEWAVEANRVLVVTGAPGSGKTTLVQHLAKRFAEREATVGGEALVPLVLLARTVTVEALRRKRLERLLNVEERLLLAVRKGRPAIVMVDGLDETTPELRGTLLAVLQSLLRESPKIRLMLTGRPNCEPDTANWGEAARFSLAPMSDEEAKQCIRRWCEAAEASVTEDQVEARRLARKAAEDLIQRMDRSDPVRRIATNPLLCTILCMVHRFLGQRIPERRFALYERCSDVLLYDWDRARLPEGAVLGRLDSDQRRALLRVVARHFQEQHVAVLPREAVVAAFREVLPTLGLPAGDAPAMLDEIRDRSGLLAEQRPGFFAFAHLTFQEYFAALDVAARRDLHGLMGHLEEPWWDEVFALSAAALGADAGRLVQRLLKVRGDRATCLLAMIMNTAAVLHAELRERVLERLRAMIPPKTAEQSQSLEAADMAVAPDLMAALRVAHAGRAANPQHWLSGGALKESLESFYHWGEVVRILAAMRYEPAVPLFAELAERRLLAKAESHLVYYLGGTAWMGLTWLAGTSMLARTVTLNLARKVRRNAAGWPTTAMAMDLVSWDCQIRPELERILTEPSSSRRSSSSPKPSRRTASAPPDKER